MYFNYNHNKKNKEGNNLNEELELPKKLEDYVTNAENRLLKNKLLAHHCKV